MFIDTHCHLEMIIQYPQLPELSKEHIQLVKNTIEAAQQASVNQIVTIGTTYQRCLQGIQIAQTCDPVFATIGIHPCDITSEWKRELQTLEKEYLALTHPKIVGIGETGLDFYHPGFHVETQKTVFRYQIELALTYDLALVVHTRSAIDETLAILREYKNNNLRAVIHCFGESLDIAREVVDLGFIMGIGGIITYPKNEYLRDMVRHLSLNNIVLETDSPFLPPQHMRGKPNSPANVRVIGDYCAELLGLPLEAVESITTGNARALFKIPVY